MTQDLCFDNGHRAASSKDHSSATNDDQVSDDLDNSKNSVASNVVNSVREFNVDVNSRRGEHRADNDEAIVRNSPVDSDSPSTGEVLSKSDPPSVYACSKQNSDNLVSAIDVRQSECANNISLPDMTVVTHQNSSENIREIIANSDQVNKFPNDTRQLPGIENNAKSVRVPATERVSKKRIAKKSAGDSVDKTEDPIVRLNKLRASISSALSEVKGVLRQYSTEQSIDGENESATSSQDKKDDGPVRFRFVRKIRRKSVFSEDDETPIPEHIPDVTTPTSGAIIVNETAKSEVILKDKNDQQTNVDRSAAPTENNAISSGENKDKSPEKSNDSSLQAEAIVQHKAEVGSSQGLKDQVAAIGVATVSSESSVLQGKQTESTTEAEHKHQQNTPLSVDSAEASPVIKTKTGKTKKVVKKDRRASIAAVEINQAPTDKLLPQLDLKAQRRPSDSGTVVKETVRVKTKSSGKPKLPPGPTAAKTQAGTNATASDHMQSIKEDATAAKLKTIPTVKIVDEIAPKVEKAVDSQSSPVKSEIPASAKVYTEKAVHIPSNHITDTTPTAKVANETSLKPHKSVHNQSSLKEASTMKPDAVFKAEAKDDIKAPTSEDLKQSTTPGVPTAPTNEKPTAPSIAKQTAVLNEGKPSEKPTTPNSQNQIALKQTPPGSEKPTAPSTEKQVPPSIQKPAVPHSEKQASFNSVKQTPPSSEKPTAPNNDTKLPVVNSAKAEVAKVISANNQLIPPVATKADSPSNSNKPLPTNGAVADVKAVQTIPPIKPLETAAPAELNGPTPVPKLVDTVDTPQVAPKKPTLVHQQNVVEPEDDTTPSTNDTTSESATEPVQPPPPPPPAKKKRKAKRKVVIRRIKRKLSKDDTFFQSLEAPAELEICEKEIEEKDVDEEPEEETEQLPKQPKPCIKARTFEIGDIVMYAERYRKTQVKWRKGTVIERITSISYKLNLGEGEEVPAHISYIKKFTDRKVNFGGKEYLEIDYAQIEEDEEKERNYSIWNLV